ncbi:MAG: hypothetical protein JXR44_08965 [Thiotrichales bacterium]|nr:hypothetical protein [Thiotrichales bacterium]
MTKKFWLGIQALTLTALLAGCSSSPPPKKSLDDICSIFYHDQAWFNAAQKSYQRWGTPPWIQLAFIHQESTFTADAKPKMEYFLGIPIGRASSAYGYAQATDEAWYDYQKSTGRWTARRSSLDDALDFIGWYNFQSFKRLGIERSDAFKLYLAYHEGHSGYRKRTYLQKSWLPPVAKKVANRSRMYQGQYSQCR